MGTLQSLGQTVVLQRKFNAEDWLRLVDTYKVTSTFSALTPIRLILQPAGGGEGQVHVSSMKRMVANAAPWSFALKQMYVRDFPADSLWEVYGSTELGVNCVLKPEDQMRKPGSCGQPAPMVEVKLFDDDGNEVTGTGPEATGELFVKSPSVFADYYKQHGQVRRPEARLPDRRRHRLPGRRGLHLHLRPQEGHDHQRRHEHLPREIEAACWSTTPMSSRSPCSACRARSGGRASMPSWCSVRVRRRRGGHHRACPPAPRPLPRRSP
ncbi:MAG: AMP-binding protein [Ilumatobacteraceae bacterium]